MNGILQDIAEELQNNGNWRREKADQYLDDIRNVHAAAIFDQLSDQVGKIKDHHPLLQELDAVNDEIVRLENTDLSGLVEEINEYNREIGFHRFPESIGDYLDGLIEVHEGFLDRTTQDKGEGTNEVAEGQAAEAAHEAAVEAAEEAAKEAAEEAYKEAYDEAYKEAYDEALAEGLRS